MNYETSAVRLWLKEKKSARVKECVLMARDRGEHWLSLQLHDLAIDDTWEHWLSFQLHDILTDDTWVVDELVRDLTRSSLLRVDWLILARELLA